MSNNLNQNLKKPSQRKIIKTSIPRRKPSRLDGKAQNVGIKPVQKKKKG